MTNGMGGYASGTISGVFTRPYGLKTSIEETKNKYPGFPTIFEQKSKLTMLEVWSVIHNRSI